MPFESSIVPNIVELFRELMEYLVEIIVERALDSREVDSRSNKNQDSLKV
jgi:hypothetical protein